MDGNETEDTVSSASAEVHVSDESHEEIPTTAAAGLSGTRASRVHHKLDTVKTKTSSHLKRLYAGTLGSRRKEKGSAMSGKSGELSENSSESVAANAALDSYRDAATDRSQGSENSTSSLQDGEAVVELKQDSHFSKESFQSQLDSDAYHRGKLPDLLLSGRRRVKEPVVAFTKIAHHAHKEYNWPSQESIREQSTVSLSSSPSVPIRRNEVCEETKHTPKAVSAQPVPLARSSLRIEHCLQNSRMAQTSEIQEHRTMAPDPPLTPAYILASQEHLSHSDSTERVSSLKENNPNLAMQYNIYPDIQDQQRESQVQMNEDKALTSPPILQVQSVCKNKKVPRLEDVTEVSRFEPKERHISESPGLCRKVQAAASYSPKFTAIPQNTTSPRVHIFIKHHIPETEVALGHSPKLPSAPMPEQSPEASPRPKYQHSEPYSSSLQRDFAADHTVSRVVPKPRDSSQCVAPTRPAPQPPQIRATITQYPGPIKGYTTPTSGWSEAQPPPLPPPPRYSSRPYAATPCSAPPARSLYFEAEPRPYMPTTEPLPHTPRSTSFFRSFKSAGKDGFFSRRWSSSEQTRSAPLSSLTGLASSARWKSAWFRDSMSRQFSRLSATTTASQESAGSPVDPKRGGTAWIYTSPRSASRDSLEEKERDRGRPEAECLFGEDIYRFLVLQLACCCCWPIGLASWILNATVLQGRGRPAEACIHTMAGQLSWYALLVGIASYLLFMVFLLSLLTASLGHKA